MAILDIFSAQKRRENKLEREIRHACNKFKPKDYRQMSLHFVIQEARAGNERAIAGLLSRFAVNAEPTIEDEREKDWVCEALIEMGEKALPQIRKTLRMAESVTWIHRTLRNIVSEDEYKKELLDVLADFDIEYERNPDRKLQTISGLAEVEGGDVVEALLRFLEDVDETVRFQTVATLVQHADEQAREPLLKAMCEDESIRIRNEIVDAFCKLEWPTTGYKKTVESILPNGYKQDKSGKITKLGS